MKTETLHFTIEGSFITNFAREKLYKENNFNGAIDILMNCLMTDSLTKDEIYNRALAILDGTKCLAGTYPYADYGLYDEEEPRHMLKDYFVRQQDTIDQLKREKDKLLYQYLELCDKNTSEQEPDGMICDETELDKLKAEGKHFIIAYEGNRFSEARKFNDLYGFIEPDGTFHQVDWAKHEIWARDYVDAHYGFDDNSANLYSRIVDGKTKWLCYTDILVYKLHWVLLDSPSQCLPNPTFDETYGLKKKKKEVLFDFYMATRQNDKANKLYADE